MRGLATGSRGARRGISLAELLVAMAGVSVVVTTTAMLLHGAMRAQSEARRFLDEERASARLARAFRGDVRAAAGAAVGTPVGIVPAADGALVSLRLPDGGRIDYRLRTDAPRIERRCRAADGSPVGPRENYAFAGPFAATVTIDRDTVRLEIGADDGSGAILPPGTALPPETSGEARRRPPALVVEARLGHDHRFAARGGEEAR